jgi:hypothetical protein
VFAFFSFAQWTPLGFVSGIILWLTAGWAFSTAF